MNLSELVGNPRIRDQLSGRRDNLSHAYILSGPAGSGKHTLARLLAEAMLCTDPDDEHVPCGSCLACRKVIGRIHPDVTVIAGAEDKPVSIEQVRAMRTDAYIQPNEGKRKIYIIEEADRMLVPAQNVLLKLLEDGPGYAAFLLLAEHSGAMLQTVRSRCEELPLLPVPPKETEDWLRQQYPLKPEQEIRQAVTESQGLLGRAREFMEGGNEKRSFRRKIIEKIVQAVAEGSELDLFIATQALDTKWDRGELNRTLEELEQALVDRMTQNRNRVRLMRAVEQVRYLRSRMVYNPGAGVLSSYLCAAIYR